MGAERCEGTVRQQVRPFSPCQSSNRSLFFSEIIIAEKQNWDWAQGSCVCPGAGDWPEGWCQPCAGGRGSVSCWGVWGDLEGWSQPASCGRDPACHQSKPCPLQCSEPTCCPAKLYFCCSKHRTSTFCTGLQLLSYSEFDCCGCLSLKAEQQSENKSIEYVEKVT